jgi:pimeloyl-ACP methyl ester carboxylesterase
MVEIRSRRIEAGGLIFAIDEAGTGDDVALLLHGFPESRFAWRHQLPALADLGWRAVAPDLRGYGDSSRPKGVCAYRMAHLVEDVAALFDALGTRRRLLIAHDWGGLIAWAFAIQARLPLDGLVVMNAPHPAVYQQLMRRSFSQWRRSWYVFFFQLPALPEQALAADGARRIGQAFLSMAVDKSRFPPAVLDHYRANASRPGAMSAMINYYRANFWMLARYPPGRTPVIETPTLLIWGEQDAALGLELTQGLEAYVADLTLARLPGVSHWVQQEASEKVNDLMARWLDTLPAPGGFKP